MIPDGMQEYIEELTTIQARTEPKEASFKYEKRDPRNWGAQCPTCKRVIGKPEDLPQNPHDPTSPQYRCPYCNSQIMPDWSSEKFRYLDVNSKVREYLGRESPKNHD